MSRQKARETRNFVAALRGKLRPRGKPSYGSRRSLAERVSLNPWHYPSCPEEKKSVSLCNRDTVFMTEHPEPPGRLPNDDLLWSEGSVPVDLETNQNFQSKLKETALRALTFAEASYRERKSFPLQNARQIFLLGSSSNSTVPTEAERQSNSQATFKI